MWAPQVFSKIPKSDDNCNSDCILKNVKHWVYSSQLPTWITLPNSRAFNFLANMVIFFPLPPKKNKICKAHPDFLFLDPILVFCFLPFMRCIQHNPPNWYAQSLPLWFNIHSNLVGRKPTAFCLHHVNVGRMPSAVLMYLHKKILSKEKCWPRTKRN